MRVTMRAGIEWRRGIGGWYASVGPTHYRATRDRDRWELWEIRRTEGARRILTAPTLREAAEGAARCPTCGADPATCASECKTAPCCCDVAWTDPADTGSVAIMLALVLAVAVPVALALYAVSFRLAPMLAGP